MGPRPPPCVPRLLSASPRGLPLSHLSRSRPSRPASIGATTTKPGLKVECVLDERTYEKGIKGSDAEMRALNITGDAFHPEWNHTSFPSGFLTLSI
jgi:hypothetical protein